MSRLVSRILLSIFMFPLAGVFYLFVFVAGEPMLRVITNYRTTETIVFIASGVATWFVVGIYWCLLWRSGIAWTPRRVMGTVLSVFGAAVIGLGAGAIAAIVSGEGSSFGAFVGGVVAIIAWLIATVFVWRETALERAQRVRATTGSSVACPTCGYNLTGLTEARCPECGSKFTLDELLAAQRPKTEVEIE